MPQPPSDLVPLPARRGASWRAVPPARHARHGELVALGPGRESETPPAAGSAPVSDLDVFGFPVQIGKVQPPLLPAETLSRERLLDWMAAKIHSRLVLIVADPGHGKTTLLADWTRRTRVRTLWYRLDEADRDWVVFVHHVVAAGREVDPAFAPNTMSLLRELGAGMGDRAAIVRTLLAEIRAWVTTGTALLLDDYHVIDDVPEIREIIRELLLRGPERLSLVVSTRRGPTLPLARLRALGETAQLGTADLRFDRAEMERLFRETYRHPLEPDLLDDLARTTEGWVATLRLVETAVRGRPRHEIRSVIQGLSARHGDLHDYLAEEVVGRMPVELQAFLERLSLLLVATPQLAAVAAAVGEADARRLLDAAEEAGLLSRRGRAGQAGRLLHPLVRSFLEGRLLDAVGADGVAATHARIAGAAEANSWWLAAHHYAAAGRPSDVARVLSSSLEVILGSGGAQVAVDLMTNSGIGDDAGWTSALRARSWLREGMVADARNVALRALARSAEGDPTIPMAIALAVLTTVESSAGEYAASVEYATRLRNVAQGSVYGAIADSMIAVAESMLDGSLRSSEAVLGHTAQLARQQGHEHYFGITHLNISWSARARLDADRAMTSARLALDALGGTSAGPEMDTGRTVLAWAYAHQGDTTRALDEIHDALSSRFSQARFEAMLEAADVVGSYVDPDRGLAMVADAEALGATTRPEHTYVRLFKAEALIRCGRPAEATAELDQVASGQYTGYPGFYLRVAVARALIALMLRSPDVLDHVHAAWDLASRQGADGVAKTIRLYEKLAADPSAAADLVTGLWSVERGLVFANAEAILSRIGDLGGEAAAVVRAAAEIRPARWLTGLRHVADGGDVRSKWVVGPILEAVGEKVDVRRLRLLSRELKGQFRSPTLGRTLARSTADRVWVEDQGRIEVRVGHRTIPGTDIRRRPLSLLCYLLTRPGLSATRDQVLDALWPDSDPEQAVNSLHQSVYFLRRVIEPSYSDDLSPGYVNQDAELVWLDDELITSRSVRCRQQLRALGPEPPVGDVLAVAAEYRGRFALDFSYEDWAAAYRESLHAQFLEVMERTVSTATTQGRFVEAMELSRAILDTDPSLDHIHASLVKLYQLLGAHAAAAEQYQQYTTVLREELGIDAPPLDEL